METNFIVFPLAALIPLVIGAIYFNPGVMGKAWMAASGVTEEQAQSGNMAKIFGLAYLFSLMLTLVIFGLAVHQGGVQSLLLSEPGFGVDGDPVQMYFEDFMKQYGEKHRTFGHGLLHGVFGSLLFAWPIIGTIALFERKGWKYTAVHTAYWTISIGLMGGVLAAFA